MELPMAPTRRGPFFSMCVFPRAGYELVKNTRRFRFQTSTSYCCHQLANSIIYKAVEPWSPGALELKGGFTVLEILAIQFTSDL
jgi:hypothetical protein